MVSKHLLVKNQTGLHARPASQLVRLCQKFDSNITIEFGDNQVNPKSILSLLSGGITEGSEINLKVDGSDEKEALKEIADLINNFTE